MKPIQMRIRAKFARTIRQHTPRVFGQKGLGADIVSTARPAFIVLFDLTVDIPLAPVSAVPLLFTLRPLRAVPGLYPTPTLEAGTAGVWYPGVSTPAGSPCLL